MSAIDVINLRVVQEAQRELIYTSAPVKRLAAALGFDDEAYFSRFFKKHAGIAPKDFRNNALRDMSAPQSSVKDSRMARS
jgi:AraC family transcriptional activator of pobA